MGRYGNTPPQTTGYSYSFSNDPQGRPDKIREFLFCFNFPFISHLLQFHKVLWG